MTGPLVIVPAFLREPLDLNLTVATLESIRETAPSVDVVIVDDGSPAEVLVEEIAAAAVRLECELHRQPENSGFSRAVNVGLRKAKAEGRDAVLLNADMQLESGWLEGLSASPAAVTGALLVYPGIPGDRLIQHGGVFYSFLTRTWDHRFRFAPETLPEAHVECSCPVTAALQYITAEALDRVGIYDESFMLSHEDVDYCLRVFEAGLECRYLPTVVAVHHESVFRARVDDKLRRWQEDSYRRLVDKWRNANFAKWVPELV